jgi:hypothetical protein
MISDKQQVERAILKVLKYLGLAGAGATTYNIMKSDEHSSEDKPKK